MQVHSQLDQPGIILKGFHSVETLAGTAIMGLPCLNYLKLPYIVISSWLIYYHLWQKLSNRRCRNRRSTNQGNHTIAIHSAVHLPIGWKPWHHPGWHTGLTNVTVASLSVSVRHKQWVSPALAVFKCTVFVISKVIFRTDILCPTSEAENTCFAIASWGKQGTTDT